MIIIAHRLSTVRNCDVIYEIKEGKAEKLVKIAVSQLIEDITQNYLIILYKDQYISENRLIFRNFQPVFGMLWN